MMKNLGALKYFLLMFTNIILEKIKYITNYDIWVYDSERKQEGNWFY